MKVKDLTKHMGDFGTNPYVYIQMGGSILAGGSPDEIGDKYGSLTVLSFISANRGQLKIFVKQPD